MNRSESNSLARDITRHLEYEGVPGGGERAASLVHDHLALKAEQFLPDDAIGAAATREDGSVIVAAVAGGRLYAMEGVLPDSDLGRGAARCTMRGLDPSRDQVSVESAYTRNSLERWRRSEWRFTVGDLSFVVKTDVDEEEEAPPAEQFAQALAAELGWSFSEGRADVQRVA